MRVDPQTNRQVVQFSGLDRFARAYIEAALWSSTVGDDVGTPLDRDHSLSDFTPETLEIMAEKCADFRSYVSQSCSQEVADEMEADSDQAGHDFWLTKEHHGCGFWDGDWSKEAGKALTDASHTFSEDNLYVGDDGRIYIQ